MREVEHGNQATQRDCKAHLRCLEYGGALAGVRSRGPAVVCQCREAVAGTRPWGVRKQGTLNPGRPLKQNQEVAKLNRHEDVGKAERQ